MMKKKIILCVLMSCLTMMLMGFGKIENDISAKEYFISQLPNGWETDTDISMEGGEIYAPKGGSDSAGCYIAFSEEYVGIEYVGYIELILENKEEIIEEFKEFAKEEGLEIIDMEIDYQETYLGEAVKMTFSMIYDGEFGISEVFVIIDNNYFYLIEALRLEDATEDSIGVLREIIKGDL